MEKNGENCTKVRCALRRILLSYNYNDISVIRRIVWGKDDRYEKTDGDITQTPAGQVTLQISGSSESDLQITYQDREFPDGNYADKALSIIPDGDTWWYGDVTWFAQVNHTGNFGTTFALALVEDTLVIQNYFTLDGAPCVGYEIFRRVN